MAATSSSSMRSVLKLSKSLLKQHPSYCVQSLFSRACFSTSFERAQGLKTREHEQDVTIDNMSGVYGFVDDAARHDAAETAEVAEDMIDFAKETMDSASDSTKETMDSAYDGSKKTTQKVSETLVAEADENVVDTSEYRSIEDHLSQLDDNHEHH